MIRALTLLAAIIGTTVIFTTLGIFTAFVAHDPYDVDAVNRICSISLLVGFIILSLAALGVLAAGPAERSTRLSRV